MTPPGGSKIALALGYPFRASQTTVSQLDAVNAIDSVSAASTLCNVTTSQWSPAPAPAPTPTPVPGPTPVSPSTLTHGKDLTLAMVGPAAIGITNYLAGGGYTFYGGGYGQHDITMTNNIFGSDVWPSCGYWGAVAYWSSGPGNVWTNNKKSDGTAISP